MIKCYETLKQIQTNIVEKKETKRRGKVERERENLRYRSEIKKETMEIFRES